MKKKQYLKYISVFLFLSVVCLFAVSLTVRQNQAAIVTRFGNPVKTIVEPGLYFRMPPPVEKEIKVDLRLRTTASGLYSVQLSDGTIIVTEAFVIWRVPAEKSAIETFVRSLGNDPREAAVQLRSISGSALQTVSGSFTMPQLINTDPEKIMLAAFEKELADIIRRKTSDLYGIDIVEVGIERLMVPQPIVASTIQAMIEDRRVLAQKKRSEGVERAGQIMSRAHSEARRIVADARSEASEIEAEAKSRAAEIYASVYEKDASLYSFMRGMKTLEKLMNEQTTLVLRTDSWPLGYLADPPGMAAGKGGVENER